MQLTTEGSKLQLVIKDIDVVLTPEEAAVSAKAERICAERLHIRREDISGIRFIRRSIDARRQDVKINARIRVFIGEEEQEIWKRTAFPESVKGQVVVVGSGPAGLFAALTLLEKGIRPIVLERGHDVHQRKRDTAMISREGKLDEESNYAFGEGGAGAFSDGKLFTRSVKRGDVSKVLSLFCQHGADNDIISDAHPHIGTEKLPAVIENIRRTIEGCGGEVLFSKKVVSLIRSGEAVTGVRCADGSEYAGPVILATGHSARDVYRFLDSDGFRLESKDVAVGVRLEHPQALIDQIQYHNPQGRGRYLPAASYRFVTQVEGRGVYSFCMCPGGFIIPASTEQGALVVNGMSPSRRSSRWANSGMVVQLKCEDIPAKGLFAMMDYLESIERSCFIEGYKAPAVRMTDFIQRRTSQDLPASSYVPGLVERDLEELMPHFITSRLREGFLDFNRMTRGRFLTEEAVLIAPETRTSSPVRITRGEDFSACAGLYPCGEGAGFAGGIVSAALDGIAAAESLIMKEQLL